MTRVMPVGRRFQVKWTEENCYEVDARGCWIWRAYLNTEGYGMIRRDGHSLAHRWMYTIKIGPIPDGMELDHLCRVRACINPKHLEPVPPRVNSQRAGQAKWAARGNRCKHGHEMTAANTYERRGQKECRRCHADQVAARKARIFFHRGDPVHVECASGSDDS